MRTFKGKPSKVMGAAFTSDGQYVVISNFAGELSLWKVNSGKRVWTIQLISKKITSLCFAADDNSFIAGYGDGSLGLHNTENGEIIRRYSGHKDAVISCSFSADGKLVTSGSDDETAKVWNADSCTLLKTFTEESSVVSVRFSSQHNRLLVGCANGTIKIRDPRNWKLLMTFRDKNTMLTNADYIKNEKYVISSYASGELKVMSIFSENIIRQFGSPPPPVDHVGYLNNGRLLLTAKGGIISVWDTQECILLKRLNTDTDTITYIDYRSKDKNIAFHTPANGMQRINIETGKISTLTEDNSINMNYRVTSPDGKYYLTYGMSRYLYKVESGTGNWNKRRYAGHSKRITCAAYSPDGGYALTGSNDKTIIMWNLALGFPSKTYLGHYLPVTSVGFSPTQDFIVSGSRDTTTRIWDARSGNEIVKLIADKHGEWIIATPDGYYNCSPEGSNLLYWVFPKSVEGYSYEQFESIFKRPDIIRERLAGQFDFGKPAPEITKPPSVEMVKRRSLIETKDAVVTISARVRSPDIVDTVRVFVNGKPSEVIPVNTNKKDLSINVKLFAGANRITAVAYDKKGFSSNPEYIDVLCRSPKTEKPNLNILSIGVSKYPHLPSSWQLEYAHRDAKNFIKALSGQKGKVFNNINPRLLINEQANKANILNSLDELEKVSSSDVVLILLAGHGIRDDAKMFYFLPFDSDITTSTHYGIGWRTFQEKLEKIRGRVILLLDACHSASIVKKTVVPNDELAEELFSKKRGGIMIFSASKGRQYSFESPDFGGGSGVFTYALTQGVGPKSKKADMDGNGSVEFMELVDYVVKYVNEKTGGHQTPWLSRKELFGDLPLALVVN